MIFDVLCSWLVAMGGSVTLVRLPKGTHGTRNGKHVFIDRRISIEKRELALAHEIAHILLGHTSYSTNTEYLRQERAATYLSWFLLEAVNQGVTSLTNMRQYLEVLRTSILRSLDAPGATAEEPEIAARPARRGLPRQRVA